VNEFAAFLIVVKTPLTKKFLFRAYLAALFKYSFTFILIL